MKKNKEKKPTTMNSLTELATLIGKDPKEVEEEQKKEREEASILVEEDDEIMKKAKIVFGFHL